MLIRAAELQGIRAGTVDLAFRRWSSARVRVGTRLRTQIGLVEVLSVDEVALDTVDEEAAGRAGSAREELVAFLGRRPDSRLFRIELRYAGADPRVALRAEDRLLDADRTELTRRLRRFDSASRRGPWTASTLEIVARRPATRAAELAGELRVETQVFKRDVRKLKELGLTESLEVGYRLSPRGRAFLAGDEDHGDG